LFGSLDLISKLSFVIPAQAGILKIPDQVGDDRLV